MKQYQWLCLFVVIFLSSCAPTMQVYQQISSGKVGCSPEDIQVSETKRSRVGTWIAECKGIKYYCSATPTGTNVDISCAQAK